MNDTVQTLGYQKGESFLHRLNGTSKLLFFVLASAACMTTYDTRFLLFVGIASIFLFKISGIRWRQVSFVMKFIFVFSLLNLVAVFLFDPAYAEKIYESKTTVLGNGYFHLTLEELFYLFNLILKYCCTVPLAVLFLLTTNPSQFASSLNKIGVSYKISYAVSLALRYIPDVQEDFFNIILSQQARGYELSRKAGFIDRIKGYTGVLLPLIFSSLERIDSISTAMELRRFGKGKRRTWYTEQKFSSKDIAVIFIGLFLLLISICLFFVNKGRFYNPFV
ncbi:energy-coupling factor transport system permease protein [Pilibacter termitis]|uniref:Energy-coupling factor transport system permease protein n=1 Tax=Pilibacter termitis TaxID=263852 RepID=A0A1T4KIC2_9ENTE|nr:energy-coupling factor transporter transmembrane component T [Pilibacter termitis]SJZ42160.1 energy-coupling factor transport system permease protein [Pilibacter termitis]